MRHIKRLKLLLLALLVGAVPLLPSGLAHADPLGQMTLHQSPYTDMYRIVEGSDGNLWAPLFYSNKIIKMTRNGSFTTYNTPTRYKVVASNPDGGIWAADSDLLSKISTNGVITSYVIPTSLTGSNNDMETDEYGNVWITSSGLVKFSSNGSHLNTYSMGTSKLMMLDYDSTNDAMWYGVKKYDANQSPQGSAIGKIDANGVKTEYELPASFGFNLSDITFATDGNVWFTGGPLSGAYVGKISPQGTVTLYPIPVRPNKIAQGKDGYLWSTISNNSSNSVVRVGLDGSYTIFDIPNTSSTVKHWPNLIVAGNDGNMWATTHNTGYVVRIGTGFTDDDEDGLQYTQEIAQGTTDNNPDFDGDGLTDYVESTSYTARNEVFCDQNVVTCEYPNPLAKDIYIENDWMDKPGSGGYSMRLNNNQVTALKNSFDNKNITLHVDTGQLGGGNEVSYMSLINFVPTPGTIDFYDYKLGGDGTSAQMNPNRLGIYHYLLTGQTFNDGNDDESSGISYVGDDDFFVSYGLIKEDFGSLYTSLDTAIAGTVMHELGHNLCFSGLNNGNAAYPGQPASCRYQGIDQPFATTYDSVMNYSLQFNKVNYSNGINGSPADHDDWGAVRLGDFAVSNAGDAAHGVSKANPTFKSPKPKRNDKHAKPVIGPNMQKLKESKNLRILTEN